MKGNIEKRLTLENAYKAYVLKHGGIKGLYMREYQKICKCFNDEIVKIMIKKGITFFTPIGRFSIVSRKRPADVISPRIWTGTKLQYYANVHSNRIVYRCHWRKYKFHTNVKFYAFKLGYTARKQIYKEIITGNKNFA